MDRRVSVKSPSGFTIDLPEGAPTASDIPPIMWAQLVVAIKKANDISKQSTSNSERRVITLKVMDKVLHLLASVGWKSLHLTALDQALQDVSEGHEHPLFKPLRTSRPKETFRFLTIKAYSAAFMQFLMKSGKKKSEAAKQVADVLAKTNFRLTRGGKKASAKTVAAWRDRCIGCSSDPAREEFEWMLPILMPSSKPLSELQTLLRREVQSDPLGWLARFIKNRS